MFLLVAETLQTRFGSQNRDSGESCSLICLRVAVSVCLETQMNRTATSRAHRSLVIRWEDGIKERCDDRIHSVFPSSHKQAYLCYFCGELYEYGGGGVRVCGDRETKRSCRSERLTSDRRSHSASLQPWINPKCNLS